MSKFNGSLKKGNLQFYKKQSKTSLLELVEAFDIDKVKIGFRMFDQSREKGDRTTKSVDFYMNPLDFEQLCRDILSGNIPDAIAVSAKNAAANGKYPAPVREYEGGSKTTMKARILQVSPGKSTFAVLTAMEGPGKVNDTTGGITPAYKYNEAEAKINIGLGGATNAKTAGKNELKQFAIAGLRAVDYYYLHYFGRYDPETGTDYGR